MATLVQYAENNAEQLADGTTVQAASVTFAPEANARYAVLASGLARPVDLVEAVWVDVETPSENLCSHALTALDLDEYVSIGGVGYLEYDDAPPALETVSIAATNCTIKNARLVVLKMGPNDFGFSNPELINNTSSSLTTIASMPVNLSQAGDYLALVSCSLGAWGDPIATITARMYVDSTQIGHTTRDMKEGYALGMWLAGRVVNLTAGAHTIQIRTYTNSAPKSVISKCHNILLLNVADLAGGLPAHHAFSTASEFVFEDFATFQDFATPQLTKTTGAGDHLVLGYANFGGSPDADGRMVRLVEDGVDLGTHEQLVAGSNISAQCVYWNVVKRNLTAGEHTWKFQAANKGEGTAQSLDRAIAVIPIPGAAEPADQYVAPQGIAPTVRFGTPAVSGPSGQDQNIAPTGIASTNAFGIPTIETTGDLGGAPEILNYAATDPSTYTSSNVTQQQLAFEVPEGTDALFISVTHRFDAVITVDWNGSQFGTEVGFQYNGSSHYAKIFRLDNPVPGAGVITARASGSVWAFRVVVYAVKNLDLSVPTEEVLSAFGVPLNENGGNNFYTPQYDNSLLIAVWASRGDEVEPITSLAPGWVKDTSAGAFHGNAAATSGMAAFHKIGSQAGVQESFTFDVNEGGGGLVIVEAKYAPTAPPPADQEIKPQGIPSTNAFGTPQKTPGPIGISPSGIASTLSFGTPNVYGVDTIAPTGIASTVRFGTPNVAPGTATLTPSGIASTVRFGTPAFVPGAVSVAPSGIASTARFGGVTVTPGSVTKAPSGIASTVRFGTPTLSAGPVNIAPTGIAPTVRFGTPQIYTGAVAIAPTGIASTARFGTPSLTPGPVNIAPAGIASTVRFGAPGVTPGPRTIAPTGIASTVAFGGPSVTPGARTIAPTGIASTARFGTPGITPGPRTIAPAGIASTVRFGEVIVEQGGVTIRPTGIGSTARFGVPSVTPGAVTMAPASIVSTVRFGVPSVVGGNTLSPSGIASTARFGTPTVTPGAVNYAPKGIAPAVRFGVPVLSSGVEIRPIGISSTVRFGTPSVAPGPRTIAPTGIASTTRFGSVTVTGGSEIRPSGIASTIAFGTPTITPGPRTIAPFGIASTVRFGSTTVAPGTATTNPKGIASTVTFGTPSFTPGPVGIKPSGIASTVRFGTPLFDGLVRIAPTGIASTVRFGSPRLDAEATIAPVGIASTTRFGTPSYAGGPVTLTVAGIASTVRFGSVFVSGHTIANIKRRVKVKKEIRTIAVRKERRRSA